MVALAAGEVIDFKKGRSKPYVRNSRSSRDNRLTLQDPGAAFSRGMHEVKQRRMKAMAHKLMSSPPGAELQKMGYSVPDVQVSQQDRHMHARVAAVYS